jgi:hypothetical protein
LGWGGDVMDLFLGYDQLMGLYIFHAGPLKEIKILLVIFLRIREWYSFGLVATDFLVSTLPLLLIAIVATIVICLHNMFFLTEVDTG